MPDLGALIAASPDTAINIGGLLIGIAFGFLVHRGNYCTMGAISDWWTAGNSGRLGAVALAAATAIVGAQTLDALAVTDLSKSIYLAPRINWLGALVGGLVFGAGMVYAGGCPSRTLVRTGGGDMRGAVSLIIMAIAAYATISGVLAAVRVGIDSTTAIDLKSHGFSSQSLTGFVSGGGVDAYTARLAASALIAVPLLAFAILKANILSSLKNFASGIGIGLLATAGWMLTGLASDEFAVAPVQPASLSFVKPVGDAIDWIERSTALGLPGFAASSVFGVLAGAFFSNVLAGSARTTAFADRGDFVRHLTGAAAMGIGGVLALGCSIGQGVTGVSTLAVQSLIACAAIFTGAVLALMKLERDL